MMVKFFHIALFVVLLLMGSCKMADKPSNMVCLDMDIGTLMLDSSQMVSFTPTNVPYVVESGGGSIYERIIYLIYKGDTITISEIDDTTFVSKDLIPSLPYVVLPAPYEDTIRISGDLMDVTRTYKGGRQGVWGNFRIEKESETLVKIEYDEYKHGWEGYAPEWILFITKKGTYFSSKYVNKDGDEIKSWAKSTRHNKGSSINLLSFFVFHKHRRGIKK